MTENKTDLSHWQSSRCISYFSCELERRRVQTVQTTCIKTYRTIRFRNAYEYGLSVWKTLRYQNARSPRRRRIDIGYWDMMIFIKQHALTAGRPMWFDWNIPVDVCKRPNNAILIDTVYWWTCYSIGREDILSSGQLNRNV